MTKNREFLIGQFAMIPSLGKFIGQIVSVEHSTEDGTVMPVLEFSDGLRMPVHLNNCKIMNEAEEKFYRMLNDN